jgi:hypothetical protein
MRRYYWTSFWSTRWISTLIWSWFKNTVALFSNPRLTVLCMTVYSADWHCEHIPRERTATARLFAEHFQSGHKQCDCNEQLLPALATRLYFVGARLSSVLEGVYASSSLQQHRIASPAMRFLVPRLWFNVCCTERIVQGRAMRLSCFHIPRPPESPKLLDCILAMSFPGSLARLIL